MYLVLVQVSRFQDFYDGLYMNHKIEDHEEWVLKKGERKRDEDINCSSTTDSNSKRLKLSDKMKPALMTKVCFSSDQVTEFLDSVK